LITACGLVQQPLDLKEESRHLQLSVTGSGHNFEVGAPTLDNSKQDLTISWQREFDSTTTDRARAIGVTEWESHPREFVTSDSLDFLIDAGWLDQK